MQLPEKYKGSVIKYGKGGGGDGGESRGVLNYFSLRWGGGLKITLCERGGGLRIFPNKRIVSRYIL